LFAATPPSPICTERCRSPSGGAARHLHRYVIQGRLYGEDGVFDSRCVRLADLGLRIRERFLYEYDFFDSWQHDLRLGQVLPVNRPWYPVCIGSRRAAPTEDCSGPWTFLELRQRYSPTSIANRVLELLSPLPGDRDVGDDDDGDHDDK
jgi:hypothetical protein